MTPIELILLILVALATSMLSAVVGFGGGVLLLAAGAVTGLGQRHRRR